MSLFGFFLVLIFPYSVWIRIFTLQISVFSPNVGKYGPEKFRVWTLLSVAKCRIFFLIQVFHLYSTAGKTSYEPVIALILIWSLKQRQILPDSGRIRFGLLCFIILHFNIFQHFTGAVTRTSANILYGELCNISRLTKTKCRIYET